MKFPDRNITYQSHSLMIIVQKLYLSRRCEQGIQGLFRSRNQRFNVTYNIIFMSKIQKCYVQFQNNNLVKVKHRNIDVRYLFINRKFTKNQSKVTENNSIPLRQQTFHKTIKHELWNMETGVNYGYVLNVNSVAMCVVPTCVVLCVVGQ